MLANYLNKLRNLRTDRNRKRWSALTTHRAPHKPFLLLSVLDLVAQGEISSTLIEPSFELAETFAGYWYSVMPPDKAGNMAYPFFYMQSEGFWELVPLPGCEEAIRQQISSMSRMRQVAAGARIDEELFLLMQDPEARKKLRLALIQTYFTPEIQTKLLEKGQINQEAYAYSQELLQAKNVAAEETKPLVRDQGFRKAIISLYDHRCAICGVRMLTPEGHTIVEAAHIVTWQLV